jgi:hypothetical protein
MYIIILLASEHNNILNIGIIINNYNSYIQDIFVFRL